MEKSKVGFSFRKKGDRCKAIAHYKLECSKKCACLRISNAKKGGFASFFIGGIGVFIFLLPILTVLSLSIEISFGVIIVFIIAWLISGYFIKLFLWNIYGEEIFIIEESQLKTYNNYRFFKDNHNTYNFTNISVGFFLDENAISLKKIKIEDSSLINNRLSVIEFKFCKETIRSHREIPISEIIEIIDTLKTYNIIH